MGFREAVQSGLSKSVTWRGRARRSEFWYFQLFIIVTIVTAAILDQLWQTPVLTVIAWLGLILPSLAVTIRRLHDTDRSGGWFWISFVPLVGGFILLVFMLLDGTPEANRHGPSPKLVMT
jgi:uncharacterized membrane protein YhaH (DUF805 family)